MSMVTTRKSGVYHLLDTHALRTQRSQKEVLGIRVIVTLFLKIHFEYLPPDLTLRTLYSVHIMYLCSFWGKNSDFFPIRHSSTGLSNEMSSLRGTIWIFIYNVHEFRLQSVHWLRRSVTFVSPGRPGFYSGTLCEVCSGRCGIRTSFSSEYFIFSPASVHQRVLHTHLHLHFALTRRTRGNSLEAFKIPALFKKS